VDTLQTNNGKKGGLLKGKPHYDKNGKSLGGIKAVVTDAGGKPVELEGGEVIINKEASKKHWKELSKINQSAGNGVPIGPPAGAEVDEDPEEYKDGGKVISFNPNHIPNKWVYQYAKTIKVKHPEIWRLGGNIFGNQAFINLERVLKRGYWLDSEEWMYIKWRSYVARHKGDFRIEGVVAMLKWCDKVEKGWSYMKDLIEEKIQKIKSKKMEHGGSMYAEGGGVEDEKQKRWLGWFVVTKNFKGDLHRWLKGDLIKAEKSDEEGYVFIQDGNYYIEAYDTVEVVDLNRFAVPLNPKVHKKQFNYLKKIDKLGYLKPWETYLSTEENKKEEGGGVDDSNLSIDEYKQYYSIIGKSGLGYEFNYDSKLTAYIVPKSHDKLSIVKEKIENATNGKLTVVSLLKDETKQTSGTKAGWYTTGKKTEYFKVIKKFSDKKEEGGGIEKYAKGNKIPKENKSGDCYEAAGNIAMDDKLPKAIRTKSIKFTGTPYLVQGQVTGQGAIDNVKYGHAWIEDDVFVYDFSNGRELVFPKELYYFIGKIETKKPLYFKYTFQEAVDKMLKTGHYGPWELKTETGL
jgi:hypothetical protein